MGHKRLHYNELLYNKALQSEGFFTIAEADLLIDSISKCEKDAFMLEVGSYKGRSTLFALSVIKHKQRWLVVDKFVSTEAYSGHSFEHLISHLDHPQVSILPMTLPESFLHLRPIKFQLVFIDGNHSFWGFSQDIALGIALSRPDAKILCHDFEEYYPGVFFTLKMLQDRGVLQLEEIAGTLALFKVLSRPTWLIDPEVFYGGQINL